MALFNIYKQPNFNCPAMLLTDIFFYSFHSPYTFFTGDFNIYHPLWGYSKINSFGSLLVQALEDFDLSIINDCSITYLPSPGSPSVIDLTLLLPQILPLSLTLLPEKIPSVANISPLSLLLIIAVFQNPGLLQIQTYLKKSDLIALNNILTYYAENMHNLPSDPVSKYIILQPRLNITRSLFFPSLRALLAARFLLKMHPPLGGRQNVMVRSPKEERSHCL